MRTFVVLCGALVLATCSASAAGPVRVSLAGSRPAPTIGRPWAVTLAVRPASFRGAVRITATGPGRLSARASRTRAVYRARLVFPAAGPWKLTARAGGSSSRLGSITVRRPPALRFAWPTSVDVRPDGSLLVVESGRVLVVHPARGGTRVLASGLAKSFAAVSTPSGSVYISDGPSLERLDGAGARQTIATAGEDIGPIAIAPSGEVFYATGTRLFGLAPGGAPRTIAAGLGNPHGLAITADAAVLVSDTANDRVLRIDQGTGAVSTLIRTGEPRGLDVADDGSIYVVEAETKRVGRFGADGARRAFVGPAFGDPYDVDAGPGGTAFVVDTAASGVIRRVAADGSAATVPTG